MNSGTVYTVGSSPLKRNLKQLLDTCDLPKRIQGTERIVIKPNLVDVFPPPITTPVELVTVLVDYLQAVSDAELIIAEGTASAQYDTHHVFAQLGYVAMAADRKVRLIDLNGEQSICRRRKDCLRWPEMHLPIIGYESFLLSVPVLKAHTLAGVTLSLKNMMGLAPPAHYQRRNSWKKASFHQDVDRAVADLNRYRCPDFSLLDASIGMAESHLYGPTCDPPPGLLIAGYDPIAVDAYGSELLGINWQEIGHISQLHGELGQASPLTVIGID